MHSNEFYRIKKLYESGRIGVTGLERAVTLNVITEKEMHEITGE